MLDFNFNCDPAYTPRGGAPSALLWPGGYPSTLSTPPVTSPTDSQAPLSDTEEWLLLLESQRKCFSSTARSMSPETISSPVGTPYGPYHSFSTTNSPSLTNSSSTTPPTSHEGSPRLLWSPPRHNAQQVGHPAHLAGAAMSPAAPASQPVGDIFNTLSNVSMPTVSITAYAEPVIVPLAGCFDASSFDLQPLGLPSALEYQQAPQGYNTDAFSPFLMSSGAFASCPETVPLFRTTRIPDLQLDEGVKHGRVHIPVIRPRTTLHRSDRFDRSSFTKDSRKPSSSGIYYNSSVQTVRDYYSLQTCANV
jgi:hypothetical protein